MEDIKCVGALLLIVRHPPIPSVPASAAGHHIHVEPLIEVLDVGGCPASPHLGILPTLFHHSDPVAEVVIVDFRAEGDEGIADDIEGKWDVGVGQGLGQGLCRLAEEDLSLGLDACCCHFNHLNALSVCCLFLPVL